MSEKNKGRRWVWFGGGVLVTLLVVCGGLVLGVWWLVWGVTGLFSTPPNPTNEPQVVHTFPGQLPAALAFSPDGNLLAVVSPPSPAVGNETPVGEPPADPLQLAVYDLTSGGKAFTATLARWPRSVAFSPDGKHLALGLGRLTDPVADGPPAEVVVYAVPGFLETYRGLPDPACRPDRLEFSRDLLFTFDTDDIGTPTSVAAWRFPALTPGPKLAVNLAHPHCAVVLPGGGVLVGGQGRGPVPIVERFDPAGKSLGRFAIPKGAVGPVFALRHDPARQRVTAFYQDGRQEFDPTTGEPIGVAVPYPAVGERITSVSGDGGRVAFTWQVRSSMAPDFRPWYETGAFQIAANLPAGTHHKWWVGARDAAGAFSADGTRYASGYDGTASQGPTGVRVWVSP